MYTRKQFGIELKDKVKAKQSLIKIGEWAHTTYIEYIEDIDLDFRDILLHLNRLELGPEFAISYEKLNKIADSMIEGKDYEHIKILIYSKE